MWQERERETKGQPGQPLKSRKARSMAIFSILVLLCAFASSQGRHFLIETEDNKGESAEKSDDYASDPKLLTAKEEGAILDAFETLKNGKQIREHYNELNSTSK